MIDIPDRIRDYLLAQSGVTAVTSTRIWAERDTPPTGYKPNTGGAVTFKVAGGAPAYSGAYANVRVQFKSYGVDEAAANSVYRALYDVLKRGGGGGIKSSTVETMGQTLEEPDTGWIFVLFFASFWVNAE